MLGRQEKMNEQVQYENWVGQKAGQCAQLGTLKGDYLASVLSAHVTDVAKQEETDTLALAWNRQNWNAIVTAIENLYRECEASIVAEIRATMALGKSEADAIKTIGEASYAQLKAQGTIAI